ncbi:MAG: thiopurine S-methyltransferase, partial [Acidimicrobiia bacterium]|nr:thiopurine S-methyltransferase [Acidimicrobiia bacterium]
MQQTDWESRWSAGQIPFHQPDVSRALSTYAESVWGTSGMSRVYVPLCGKSLDMVYLAEMADEVVGVEFVEQAVQEFFAERGLTPEIEREPEVRYRAGNYRLYAADVFSLTNAHLGAIDAVYDRAALVALDAETRIRYAAHMHSIVSVGARMLLVAFEYDQSQMNGPPFAVPDDEVHRLFDGGFEVETLGTRDALDDG